MNSRSPFAQHKFGGLNRRTLIVRSLLGGGILATTGLFGRAASAGRTPSVETAGRAKFAAPSSTAFPYSRASLTAAQRQAVTDFSRQPSRNLGQACVTRSRKVPGAAERRKHGVGARTARTARATDQRGLPGAQRLDARLGGKPQAARHGLAASWRLANGYATQYNTDGKNLARKGDLVMVSLDRPSQRIRLTFILPIGRRRIRGYGQCRDARHYRRPPMGAGQISQPSAATRYVTIFGESGGGGKVSAMMAMPPADGAVSSGHRRKRVLRAWRHAGGGNEERAGRPCGASTEPKSGG